MKVYISNYFQTLQHFFSWGHFYLRVAAQQLLKICFTDYSGLISSWRTLTVHSPAGLHLGSSCCRLAAFPPLAPLETSGTNPGGAPCHSLHLRVQHHFLQGLGWCCCGVPRWAGLCQAFQHHVTFTWWRRRHWLEFTLIQRHMPNTTRQQYWLH